MKALIFVDINKCLACRSCEIECAVSHSMSKELLKAIKEIPSPQCRIRLESLEGFSIPLHCRHCEAAPCIQVCPTKAIKRDNIDAPVVIDGNVCVGCSSCVIVCSFGIPRLSKDGKAVIKCDLCMERLELGEEPACVVACPTGALKFKCIGNSFLMPRPIGERVG